MFGGRIMIRFTDIKLKDNNVISTICCAQFYVTKERIHHYTYEQWSSLYRASLEPYCTTEFDRETRGVGVQNGLVEVLNIFGMLFLVFMQQICHQQKLKQILINVIYFVPLVKDHLVLIDDCFQFYHHVVVKLINQ